MRRNKRRVNIKHYVFKTCPRCSVTNITGFSDEPIKRRDIAVQADVETKEIAVQAEPEV